MFGLFKNKKQKLENQHKKTLEMAFQQSKIDRKKSDALYAEAEAILKEIEKLD